MGTFIKLLLLIIIPLSSYTQDFVIFSEHTQDFNVGGGDTIPYLHTDVDSNFTSLRLTENEKNQRGYLYSDYTISPSQKFTVEFEYSTYGESSGGADGICFFLFDADTFRVGGFGGSLGYANRFGTEPGLRGAYIGIGFDEFGNFSNPTEGRLGGPGRIINNITIRQGSDSSYKHFCTNGELDFKIFSEYRTFNPTDPNYRKVFLLFEPDTIGYKITLNVQVGNNIYKNIFDKIHYDIKAPTLKFGISASTGNSTNYHEVRNLKLLIEDSSLPVELLNFRGYRNDSDIELEWITVS